MMLLADQRSADALRRKIRELTFRGLAAERRRC